MKLLKYFELKKLGLHVLRHKRREGHTNVTDTGCIKNLISGDIINVWSPRYLNKFGIREL